ncbi:serine/threonine-protein kinase OXI1-like [Ananas comosus]|uniref:non-specific serine/threonine protein kinase n=1 Tax=Ananas comosus TaxID=4615 RepID=A0A6P5ECN3_ANACO|nr:serine/threonine-protein kinase OXI1-like [Ananas comosus]
MADSPSPSPTPRHLDLGDLKALSVLGRGAKGVVFLVRLAGGGEEEPLLALKAMSRASLERRSLSGDGGGGGAYRRVRVERDVLGALRHPLLPALRGVVSTEKVVGFAMERWCCGGDLGALRRRQADGMFSDEVIRFYAAELVLALEYLHGLGIVHRDLKSENILIQDDGHLMLVDFDLAAKLPNRSPSPSPLPPPPPPPTVSVASSVGKKKKKVRKKRLSSHFCLSGDPEVSPETAAGPPPLEAKPAMSSSKSNSFVGTEDYVAPEVVAGGGHDFAVDWWGLGVVLYEMLYGRTPFRGQNRKETLYRIVAKDPDLVGERTPLRDLIARLLEKDPAKRIACEGVKQHAFFRGVDWESVLTVARPPFIPPPGAERENEDCDAIDVEKVVEEVFERGDAAKGKGEKVEKNSCEEQVRDSPKTDDFSVF